MVAGYALALLFTLIYGSIAAYSSRAERVLLPLLDVLQSVPILSFLPVVLLSFTAVLPRISRSSWRPSADALPVLTIQLSAVCRIHSMTRQLNMSG